MSEWVVEGELDSGWCEWRRAQLIVPSGFLTIVSHFFTHRWYRTWSLQIWSLDMRIEDISKYAHNVHPSARRQLSTGQKFDLRLALLMGDPLFRWERSPLQTTHHLMKRWWCDVFKHFQERNRPRCWVLVANQVFYWQHQSRINTLFQIELDINFPEFHSVKFILSKTSHILHWLH